MAGRGRVNLLKHDIPGLVLEDEEEIAKQRNHSAYANKNHLLMSGPRAHVPVSLGGHFYMLLISQGTCIHRSVLKV